ncbi:MAG: GtrA family protein [Acidobacteria bacterium]|nr:GtrA family protein [Acidobacteriota bacterium]
MTRPEKHLADVATVLPRWMTFSAVGLLGIFVHLSLLLLLTRLEVHSLIATVLAVEATVLHNFL